MQFRNRFNSRAALVAAAAMLASGAAMATTPDPLDVSAAETAIAAMSTPIGKLGLASLLVVVGIKTWKYLRRGV